MTRPDRKVIVSADKNPVTVWSSASNAIINGGSIALLNNISSTPRILKETLMCI